MPSEAVLQRFNELWRQAGQGRTPRDVDISSLLDAVGQWYSSDQDETMDDEGEEEEEEEEDEYFDDEEKEEKEDALSATARHLRQAQGLLLDPERPDTSSRSAIRDLLKPLLPIWIDAGAESSDIYLLQVLLLSVHERGPGLVNLIGAGRALQVGRERLAVPVQHWMNGSVRDTPNTHEDKLELLWWGQARYCHTLQRPYRELVAENPDLATWRACVEVADRAEDLEYAPSAAFLVHALEDMGIDVNEKKPVIDWLSALRDVLSDVDRPVREPLATLATTDALGLPVTWCRLGREGDPGEATALPLDTPVDRGTFATWVLGELLLDARMAP